MSKLIGNELNLFLINQVSKICAVFGCFYESKLNIEVINEINSFEDFSRISRSFHTRIF
jgi:hypothetical protein